MFDIISIAALVSLAAVLVGMVGAFLFWLLVSGSDIAWRVLKRIYNPGKLE